MTTRRLAELLLRPAGPARTVRCVMSRWMLLGAVGAGVAVVLTGCAAQHTSSTAGSSLSEHQAQLAAVIARREAAGASPSNPGVQQPTTSNGWPSYVTQVRALAGLSRSDAQKYVDASSVNDDRPVIVVRLIGHFAEEHTGPAPVSPSAQSNNVSTGTAIDIVADASTGQVLDFGIGRSEDEPALQGAETLFTRGNS